MLNGWMFYRLPLVLPYGRRTKPLEAVLPRLYQKGVSNGEMGRGLEEIGRRTSHRFAGEYGMASEAGPGE